MEGTSPETTEFNARTLESSPLPHEHQSFKDNVCSQVSTSLCSPGCCRCSLCTSQCAAQGGNLSLDGSAISSCCHAGSCSDTSTSSYQDSADSERSCPCGVRKPLNVNVEAFCTEDAGTCGKPEEVPLSPSLKGLMQRVDRTDGGTMLQEEGWDGNSSGKLDLNLQNVQDSAARAVDIKIVCSWSLSEGKHGEPGLCQLDTQLDNHANPYAEESPAKANCDVRLYRPNKQVAEVRPLKATLGEENMQSLHKHRKTPEHSLHMSCTREANSDSSQIEHTEGQQTTHIEKDPGSVKYQGISVGYGSKSTVVRSESYTGDVQEIVDNVLQANLPVILLGGASRPNTAQNAVFYHPSHRTSHVTPTSDNASAGDDLKSVKPSTQSKDLVSQKSNSSPTIGPREQANFTSEIYKNNLPEQSIPSDRQLISLVTDMVRHLPYCMHRDQMFVLASDVEEVVFADHKGVTGISSSEACIDELSDVIEFCTVDSQKEFANQCQSARPNDTLVQLQWFTTESFLGMARDKMQNTMQRSLVHRHSIPLLGEVYFENHSFGMVYHYENSSRSTMVYVPACDLMAAFPESSRRLKMLAQQTYPGAATCLAWNMRFRLAEAAEARALMRYKGASGQLVSKEGRWHYLTSRSVLVHWHDFRHTFLWEPRLRMSPPLIDGQQEQNHLASSKTVSPDQGKQHRAVSVPTVKARRKSKLEKSRLSPPTHTRGKKRRRSFTKLVRKKGQNKRVKVKTLSPKMCRTSTPVTTGTCSVHKSAVGTDKEEQTSGVVSFSRNFTSTSSPVEKGSPLSTSSSKNETGGQVWKGLWKMKRDVSKLQEEERKSGKRESHKRKEDKVIKIKNEDDNLRENSSSEEEQKLKEQLEHVVNSNPFTQSIERLKMVKQLNKVVEPAKCNLSQNTIQANSSNVMRKNTENIGQVDSMPNSVEGHGSSKTVPVPTHSEQSPAVEKVKNYLKNPLQIVRNPMYLDSSSSSSLDQASTDSHILSMASDDSIVHYLSGMKSKKANMGAGMNQSANKCNRLPKEMMVPKKTTPGIFEKKTSVTHKSSKGRKLKDTTPNQYADNPMAESQRRILEVIKQNREKAMTATVKVEPSTGDMAVEKDRGIAETSGQTKQQETINGTPEITYRLFRQPAQSGPPESGVVVVQTEEPTSLPYVTNNGYPYVPLSCTRPLFPLCHCTVPTTVLKKSGRLSRCINMCSYEEAQILYWEGRHLKMPRITSGDRIVRIDQVAANLCYLRAEVKAAHHYQSNKKGCYDLKQAV